VLGNLPQGEAQVNEANLLAGKCGSFGRDWIHGSGSVAGVAGAGVCARSGAVQEANGSIWRSVPRRTRACVGVWRDAGP
jgi:hypothetical protein